MTNVEIDLDLELHLDINLDLGPDLKLDNIDRQINILTTVSIQINIKIIVKTWSTIYF